MTWNEVYARDYSRSRHFYSALFGFTYEDVPMEGEEYATISLGCDMVGGIGALAGPDTPPHVTVCFKVSDSDDVVRHGPEQGVGRS